MLIIEMSLDYLLAAKLFVIFQKLRGGPNIFFNKTMPFYFFNICMNNSHGKNEMFKLVCTLSRLLDPSSFLCFEDIGVDVGLTFKTFSPKN
jgi:hypothetical protein